MNETKLLISYAGGVYRQADLSDDEQITLNKRVEEYRDPTKKTGTGSLPLTLPATNTNRSIFFFEDDVQLLGKLRRTYDARLMQNNQTIVEGTWEMYQIVGGRSPGFRGAVGASRIGTPSLADLLLDKKLTELKSYQLYNFQGHQSVLDSWSGATSYPDFEYAHPFVGTNFAQLNGPVHSNYENLGISHFVAGIVKHIFQDAGYNIQGDILGNYTYQRLMMLYSSTERQQWNYGTLAPGRAECDNIGILAPQYDLATSTSFDRLSDDVYVLTYPFHTFEGDLCESIGTDGVYTAKYTGVYNLIAKTDYDVAQGVYAGQKSFSVFRCISDEEFIPENSLPAQSVFSTPDINYLDTETLAVWTGSNVSYSFTTRLQEGKQYQVQRYVSVPKSNGNTALFVAYNPTPCGFRVVSCDGPLKVNPALFLPSSLTQVAFLSGVFKIFNLYYQLNEATKTVTLLTRDDFFQETIENVVDMTPYLNLEDMDQLPLSQEEIGKTYLTWATDDNDYILKQTNYMSLVNGEQPDLSTKLPFAPLGFAAVDYLTDAGNIGYDLFPAIIPTSDSQDLSLLTDVDASTSAGSWVPRLLMYQGAGYLRDDVVLSFIGKNNYYVTLGQANPIRFSLVGGPGGIGGFTGGGYNYQGLAPKLAFFNVLNQPSYRVSVNTTLRSFSFDNYTGSTIYNPADANFLQDVARVPELDLVSLASNTALAVNPKGFFYTLYANDLLIGSLSNYFQGTGRINSLLFNKLTGRQVLRVGQHLFLLDSITNYQVGGDFAKYNIYKLVANEGSQLPNLVKFTSTQEATASCASGTTGDDVTATATRSSYVSQQAADNAATTAALALATAQLVCSVPPAAQWTSTATVTLYCEGDYYGDPSIGNATVTSYMSQADADQMAQDAATVDAQSRLSCYPQ